MQGEIQGEKKEDEDWTRLCTCCCRWVIGNPSLHKEMGPIIGTVLSSGFPLSVPDWLQAVMIYVIYNVRWYFFTFFFFFFQSPVQ